MQIALINKINGKFVITEITDFGGGDLELFPLWATIDDNTKFHFNALNNLYNHVYITESSALNQKITKDSFIFNPEDTKTTELDNNTQPDELSIKKFEYLKKLDLNFSANLNKINFLDYVHYITLFNYFASKGIFITEENKEDKYIEILELDDEEAIEKLELYLTIQDKINPFLNHNTKLIELKEEIEYANEEEFEEIVENQTEKLTF